MKREELHGLQQQSGGEEKTGDKRNQEKNQTSSVYNNQLNNIVHQAGLGRDRMTDLEDFEDLSEKNIYSRRDKDDLNNQNLNESNDQ